MREMLVQNNEYLKQINILKDENYDLKVNLYSLLDELKKTKKIFEQDLNEKNHVIKKTIKEKDAFQQLSQRYRKQAEEAIVRGKRLEQEVSRLRGSTSFRLGQVVVKAFAHPGKNTVLLPFRFCKLIFEMLVRGVQGRQKS
ncbi:MAG TPA: hypothetical protein ENN79_03660 [Desulfobacteraceae bacterium]|nr:hypothetical protein [Desulfobacteraceae bacterium]